MVDKKPKRTARHARTGKFKGKDASGRVWDVKRSAKDAVTISGSRGPAPRPQPTAEDADNAPIVASDIAEGKLVMVRKRGRPVGSRKTQKTVRLDDDIIEALQAEGSGWQTRMNAILREALKLDNSDAKAS